MSRRLNPENLKRIAERYDAIRREGEAQGKSEAEIRQDILDDSQSFRHTLEEETRRREERRRARMWDPAAWACLDDDQRDTINEWYQNICTSHHDEKKFIREEEGYSSLFGLIPFATAYAYEAAKGAISWSFLIEIVAAFIFYTFIFTIFKEAYLTTNSKHPHIIKAIGQGLVAVLVVLVVFMIIESRAS